MNEEKENLEELIEAFDADVFDPLERDPTTGRFLPNNKAGARSAGVPRNPQRRLSQKRLMQREAKRQAREMLNEALPGIVNVLHDKALEGDPVAIAAALRHGIGIAKAESYVPDGMLNDLALIEPESRLTKISHAVFSGDISAELGEKLAAMTKSEIDVQVYQKLRRLAKAIPRLTMEEVAARLHELAGQADEPVEIEQQ